MPYTMRDGQLVLISDAENAAQFMPRTIPTTAECLDALAARRFTAEESGTTFNGMSLQTDRVTQAKVTAAYVKAKADSTYAIANWKMAPGTFVTLSAAQIIAVGDAIAAHVQACFDHEALLSGQIEAADNPGSIDINAGWPA
jgi:hypothetical protein